MAETVVTDLTFLKNFTGGDNEKVKKYVSMFLSRAPEQLKSINNDLSAADYASLRVNAHSLKPQLSYMGIKSLEKDILNIEHAAGNGTDLDQLPSLVKNVNDTLQQAFQELTAFINEN